MEIRLAAAEQIEWAYKNHLLKAFPAEELAPLRAIRKLYDEGLYRPWFLFEGDTILGEAFIYTCEEGFGLLEYLCVDERTRNAGLGAKLVSEVCRAEKGLVLFGEAEIPEYAPDEALARRRLGFYNRCGAQVADYNTSLFGVPYHTLYWAETPPVKERLCAAHARAYRRRFTEEVFRNYVRIPWDASMGRMPSASWSE